MTITYTFSDVKNTLLYFGFKVVDDSSHKILWFDHTKLVKRINIPLSMEKIKHSFLRKRLHAGSNSLSIEYFLPILKLVENKQII